MATTYPPITASLAPTEISLETLTYLLSLYPETARLAYRDKALEKARPKLTKKAKKRAIADGTIDEIYSRQTKSDKIIDKDVESFLKLNEWRYETFPEVMRKRAEEKVDGEEGKKESDDEGDSDEEEKKRPRKKAKSVKVSGLHLEKDDLLKLVDWKLKHGTFRPTLLGMAKSNQGKVVRKHSCAAFARLPDPKASGDDSFPAAALEYLSSSLRGTGPATASLILSLAPDHGIPFFSDELYFWLCMDVYPGAPIDEEKEKKIDRNKYGYIRLKYNMREYRALWDAILALKERVKQLRSEEMSDSDSDSDDDEDDEDYFSTADIEKIGFVIGHLDKVGGWEGTAPVVERTEEEKELIAKRERNRLAYKAKVKREKEEKKKKRVINAAKRKAREERKKAAGAATGANATAAASSSANSGGENKKKRKRT